MKLLSNSEAQALYHYLLNSINPLDTFLQLLFETGARVSETLTLSAESLVGTSLGIRPLKKSLPRTVTLSANLTAKLARLPAHQWAEAIGRLATRESRRRRLCRHFHEVTHRLLGRRVNLHALRHLAFTRLYLATKDLLLVKQWAGHRSINSTMTYMAADLRGRADEAHQVLLKVLGGGAD